MLPFESGQAEIIEIQGNTLKLIPPPGDKSFEPREFIFTDIAGQKSNNQQCFEKICKNMCDAVLEGYNGVLMAYGQTGCGKTYTMLGKPDRNVLGLIPRCLKYFF
jgi:kinesin family protein 3/17